MKDSGARQGEQCALCKGSMNESAIVCGHCGAVRKIQSHGFLAFLSVPCYLLMILSLLILALSPLGSIIAVPKDPDGPTMFLSAIGRTSGRVACLVSAVLFLGLGIVFHKIASKRVVYIRRDAAK